MALFWKIQFPLQSRSTKYNIHLHVASVFLAVLLALVPVIASAAKGGFVLIRFPPILCVGRDADVSFYTLVLPINLILGVGTSLLIYLLWKVHQVSFKYCNHQPESKVQYPNL